MATINLLPWREQLREKKNRDFHSVVALVGLVSVLVVAVIYLSVQADLSNQKSRNSYLKKEISELDLKIAEIESLKKMRDQLIERMNLIQSLQGNRPVIVRIFDEVVRSVPEDLYFKDLEVTGTEMKVKGSALSNNRLSSLMRNFDESSWFNEPVLIKFEAKEDGLIDFEVAVSLVYPEQSREGGG